MNKTFSQKIKKSLTSKSSVFSIIFIVYAIIVLVVFLKSAGFLTREINNVFADIPRDDASALDPSKYDLVAKKLGIPLTSPDAPIEPMPQAVVPQATSTPDTIAPEDGSSQTDTPQVSPETEIAPEPEPVETPPTPPTFDQTVIIEDVE